MKKFSIILILLAILSSCQDNKLGIAQEEIWNENSEITCFPYTIPVDSALAFLNDYLNSDGPVSRGENRQKVANVTPIKYISKSGIKSRSELQCDNLVYVVNFEDNQGYAILAADYRIGEKVIAVTEQGSLNSAVVYDALGEITEGDNNVERILYSGYPTEGPGFYTLPEYGDELFINPNTVTLYNEDEFGTLVGNFDTGHEGAVDEDGNPLSISECENSSIEQFTASLCLTYAINELTDDEGARDRYEWIDEWDYVEKDLPGYPVVHMRKITRLSEWTTPTRTSNLLFPFVSWNQGEPFNDLCPYRRLAIIFGHKRRAPAGCFPLAVAKVFTYFEEPHDFYYNGEKVNWSGLKPAFGLYDIDNRSAALLLRAIGDQCGSWYFYEGTFTFPHKVSSYMKSVGYKNTMSRSYSFNLVTKMIDAGKPVIIYAMPNWEFWKSHAWNIDGYKIKERIKTVELYKGSELIETTTETINSQMVHCDFGWKGKCNGYYISGVFKLNDPNSEKDGECSEVYKTHYDHNLRIMTYDKN